MKHLFNFSPTVKYREGSSFLYKLVLSVLYCIPLMLLLFHGFSYLHLASVEEDLNEFSTQLEKRHAEARAAVVGIRPDRPAFWKMLKSAVAYQRLLTNIRFSWSDLFDRLEEIIPAGVKIDRIRLKPANLVSIGIEGQAREVTQVTEFLRRLYDHPHFLHPRMSRHSRDEHGEKPQVSFRMEVGYLADTGEAE